MKRKKGFTLVELLVAATIIGILAVFATAQYRNGVAETRFTQAKAMTDQLATAVQQAHIDYPRLKFSAELMENSSDKCELKPGVTSLPPSQLVACGYMDPSGWDNEYFEFVVCDAGNAQAPCDVVLGALACTRVQSDAKLPTKYKKYGYCFFAGSGGVEYTNLQP